MKASLRWLRDYAPLDAPVDIIARTLAETGTEVGAVEDVAAGIIVARVTKLEPLPGSSHGLQLAELDVGPTPPRVLVEMGIPTNPLVVVTGAPNLRVGDLVPYAPPGSRPPALAEPLGVRTYRGKYKSPGMLCSAVELGLGDDAAGILVLDRGVPGQPLRDVVDLDVVFDLDITTNRPDCLCHVGIARELTAALGETLTEPVTSLPPERESAVAAAQRVQIRIEYPEGCPRFAARVFEDVVIGPSPAWVQTRLRAIGLRPINNVVDATNFVAHELGQPLHAFDLDRFIAAAGGSGKLAEVVVRRARAGERLVTLDGVERTLSDEDIAVCAGDHVVSIAGVIGGSSTAVDESTRNVLLEAANWDGVMIRATSRRLGVRTDASTLFEKGLSDALPPGALDRAASLIAESGAGHVLHGIVDEWPRPLPEIPPIALTSAQMSAVLGYPVDATEAATVLAHLGFAVEQDGASLVVVPPFFRRDILIREDVIEEVGRMLGYHRVPSTLPGRRVPVRDLAPDPPVEDHVREVCLGAGLDEAITYSFTSLDVAARLPGLGGDRRPLPLRNPLSDEWAVLRTSQLPGLCSALALNVNRGVQNAALFELGRVFWEGERTEPPPGSTADGADAALTPLPLEPLLLSVVVHTSGGAGDAAAALRHIQSMFERLVDDVAGPAVVAVPREVSGTKPGRSAALHSGEQSVGMIAELDADVLERFELRGRVLVGELNVDAVAPARRRSLRFRPPPRFPAIAQDMAVTVPAEVRAGDALRIIRTAGGALLESVELYDEYRGGHLGEARKSWTFRLTFRAAHRTLASEEAQRVQADILRALVEECGADLRR
jgi:phenylalanyl-tRNA synthetase beta chain